MAPFTLFHQQTHLKKTGEGARFAKKTDNSGQQPFSPVANAMNRRNTPRSNKKSPNRGHIFKSSAMAYSPLATDTIGCGGGRGLRFPMRTPRSKKKNESSNCKEYNDVSPTKTPNDNKTKTAKLQDEENAALVALERKKEEELLRQHLAATKIQTVWRGLITETKFLIVVDGATQLQSVVRRRAATKHTQTLRVQQACSILQRFGRTMIFKNRLRKALGEFTNAVTVLHSFGRKVVHMIHLAKTQQNKKGLVWDGYAAFQSLRATRTRIAIELLLANNDDSSSHSHPSVTVTPTRSGPKKVKKALMTLEEATSGSKECCQLVVDAGIPLILLNDLKSVAMESPLHVMASIQWTFRILDNLACQTDCLVWDKEIMNALMNLVYTFNHLLFFKVSKLIEIILRQSDPETLEHFGEVYANNFRSVLSNKKAQWTASKSSTLQVPGRANNKYKSILEQKRRKTNQTHSEILLRSGLETLERLLNVSTPTSLARPSF